MNIIEVTKKATEDNKAIYRKSQTDIQFIPTNSGPLAFVVIASDIASSVITKLIEKQLGLY